MCGRKLPRYAPELMPAQRQTAAKGELPMKFMTLFHAVKVHRLRAFVLAASAISNIAWAQAQPAPPISGVLGKVQSFTGSSLEVATPSGVVHVTVKRPLATYKQIPSDL